MLTQQEVEINQRSDYHKGLRYYLDFCDKYRLEPSEKRNFSAFDDKLRAKNQSEIQRQQARRAIAIYYRGIVGNQVARQPASIEVIPQTTRKNGGLHLELTANRIPNSFPVTETQTIDATHTQNAAANAKASNTPSPYGANVQDKPVDPNPLKLTGANWIWVYDNLTAAYQGEALFAQDSTGL